MKSPEERIAESIASALDEWDERDKQRRQAIDDIRAIINEMNRYVAGLIIINCLGIAALLLTLVFAALNK